MKLQIAELYYQLQQKFPSNGAFFDTVIETFSQPLAHPEEKREKIHYDVEQLTIDPLLTLEEVQNAFERYSILPLRKPSQDLDTLIIGCGNYPLSSSAGNPLNLRNPDDMDYQSEHAHFKAITMDPCMSKNPTIVGMFGWQPIAGYFEGKQFSKIVFEGVNVLNDPALPYIMSDLETLLAPEGLIIYPQQWECLCFPIEVFQDVYDAQGADGWDNGLLIDGHFDDIDVLDVGRSTFKNSF